MKINAIAVSFVVAIAGAATAAYGTAQVRAFHASPDAPAVDVLVNNAPAFTNLSFGNATAYAALAAGTYNVKVNAAGTSTTVINADLNLADNTTYTVAAINRLNSITPLVLVDDNTLNPAAARLRFVHASPNAPAVDIALAGGAVLFPNVSFGGVGSYIEVPGGTYNLEVRLAGTNTTVLPLPGITVSNNTVYTAWAIGLVGETPALGAAITVDAIPSPGALALLGLGGLAATRRRR